MLKEGVKFVVDFVDMDNVDDWLLDELEAVGKDIEVDTFEVGDFDLEQLMVWDKDHGFGLDMNDIKFI